MSHDLADQSIETLEPEKPAPKGRKVGGFLLLLAATVTGATIGAGTVVGAEQIRNRGATASSSGTNPEAAPSAPEIFNKAAQTERRRLEDALNSENFYRRPYADVFISARARDGDTFVYNPILLAAGETPVWGRVFYEEVEAGMPPIIRITPFTGELEMLSPEEMRRLPRGLNVPLQTELRSKIMLDNAEQGPGPLRGLVDGNALPIGVTPARSVPGGE